MIKVQSKHDRRIYLAGGPVEPGQVGYANRAECETLHQYIEVIQDGKEEKITETRSHADDAEPGQALLLRGRGRPKHV